MEPLAAAPDAPVAVAPTRETRRRWCHAGLERDAQGLRTLLDDPHPLARLVARSALFRRTWGRTRTEAPTGSRQLDGRRTR